MVVISQVIIFVSLERSLHNVQQLFLARIIDLPHLSLKLMEPHFNRIELWTVGRQVHDLYAPLVRQFPSLLLIVDGTVVHNQPLLPLLFLLI